MKLKIMFLLSVLLISTQSFAQDPSKTKPLLGGSNYYHTGSVFKLEAMDFEHRKIEALRDPYFPNKDDWNNSTNFHFRIGLLKAFYWDNVIHMEMDQSQVRAGGWEWTMGLRVFSWMDVVKYHHSRHVMEESRQMKFPVEDSYGIKIYLIK